MRPTALVGGLCSFLKKRTKKLLDDLASAWAFEERTSTRIRDKSKSFLVLFFKKEPLPYFLVPKNCAVSDASTTPYICLRPSKRPAGRINAATVSDSLTCSRL